MLLVLSLVAAAAIAYPVEQLIVTGVAAFADSLALLAAGLLSAVVLAGEYIWRVTTARRLGVHLHLAPVPFESYRRRHQQEHELLRAELANRFPFTVITPLEAPLVDPSDAERWVCQIDDLCRHARRGSRFGRVALPGSDRLSILAAGDYGTLFEVGRALGKDRGALDLSLVVDKVDDEASAFVRVDVHEPAEAPRDEGQDLVVFDLTGRDLRSLPAVRDYSDTAIVIGMGQELQEEPTAYQQHIQQLAGECRTRGHLTVGFAGPATVALGLGWIIGRRERLGVGPARVTTLSYVGSGYVANPNVTPMRGRTSADVDPASPTDVGPDPSRWLWALALTSAAAALGGTAAIGNFATCLEWALTIAHDEDPVAQVAWLGLAGVALPALVAWWAVRRNAHWIRSPEIKLFPFESPTSPSTLSTRMIDSDGDVLGSLHMITTQFPDAAITVALDGAAEQQARQCGRDVMQGFRGIREPKLSCGDQDARITSEASRPELLSAALAAARRPTS